MDGHEMLQAARTILAAVKDQELEMWISGLPYVGYGELLEDALVAVDRCIDKYSRWSNRQVPQTRRSDEAIG